MKSTFSPKLNIIYFCLYFTQIENKLNLNAINKHNLHFVHGLTKYN